MVTGLGALPRSGVADLPRKNPRLWFLDGDLGIVIVFFLASISCSSKSDGETGNSGVGGLFLTSNGENDDNQDIFVTFVTLILSNVKQKQNLLSIS